MLDAGVDEGHGAEEEVGEQHPVDDGCPQDGQDREHSGQVWGPWPQEQATEVIELGYSVCFT